MYLGLRLRSCTNYGSARDENLENKANDQVDLEGQSCLHVVNRLQNPWKRICISGQSEKPESGTAS